MNNAKPKAIKDASPIYLNEVPDLKNILEHFVLNNYEYAYVGSIGSKTISGDVDVVLRSNINDFFDSRPELRRSAKISHGFNLASIPIPFNGKTIQLDVFFTDDLEWSKFILSGNKDRNQLLMAAIIVKSWLPLTEHSWEQKNIRIPSGVWYVEKTNISTVGNRLAKSRILNEAFCSSSLAYISDLVDCPIVKFYTFETLFEHFQNDVKILEKFYGYQANK